jgi:hypothetical protein
LLRRSVVSAVMHLCLLSTSLQMGCCGIPELHGQCCEQFRTTPEQRINVELWPVRFPESVPPLLLRSHLSLCWADRCDRRRACPLDPFRTLCHFVLRADMLAHGSSIALRTTWLNQVANVVVTARQLMVRMSFPLLPVTCTTRAVCCRTVAHFIGTEVTG